MTRQAEAEQQRILREASERFFEDLPAMHRELISLMAADAGKPPYAVIANALGDAIATWQSALMGQQMRRRF